MHRIRRTATLKGMLIASLIGGVGLAAGFATPAVAAPVAASNWHLGVYTPSGRALSQGQAGTSATGLASFQFTASPDTALLLNTQGSQRGSLLGDVAGETVTATFTITGSGDPFAYYGQGTASNPCGAPASARLFFETSNAGGFDPTHYWWSNPVGSAQLANGTFTLTAAVSPDQWSDYYGQEGTAAADGFAAAAGNVTGIGLSFGGGCFFENGVGAPDATLTLNSFTVS